MAGEWPNQKAVNSPASRSQAAGSTSGTFSHVHAATRSELNVPSQCKYMWRLHAALWCFSAMKLNCVQAGRLKRQRSLPSGELVLPL